MECVGQNLFGVNAYGSMNSISLDVSGMKRKINSVPGYGFGVVYKHMELRNIIGFQAEANFETSGFKLLPSDETHYRQDLKYFTVPIMAHLDLGKHSVKFLFAIGTYGSFLLDAPKPETDVPNIDNPAEPNDWSRIYAGKYNFFSYGLCGQTGFAICTKAGIFNIQARARVGMSKMMDMGETDILNYMTARAYGVGLSYLVPFGKGEKYYTKREKVKKQLDEEEVLDIKPESTPENTTEQEGGVEDAVEDDSAQDTPASPETEENWEERMNE